MKDKSALLLYITGSGAEILWLYAWASFLLINCFNRNYPLPEAIAAFSLAAILTRFHRGRRWRVIQIVGLQLIGFLCCGLRVVHTFYYQSQPFWSRLWLPDFVRQSRGHIEWFLLIFVSGFTVAFWITGIRFALRERSYGLACSRFDRGLAGLFVLFLAKLVLQSQVGVTFKDSTTLYLIFPFFLFGLTEIGLARDLGDSQKKEYLTGGRVLGVFSGFALGIIISGAGLFLLFLPYLTSASTIGYALIKKAAVPLAPYLIALIRFLFGYARPGPADPVLSSTPTGSDFVIPGESGGWLVLVEKIFIWAGAWLLLLVGALGVCFGIWYGIRWLFIKRAGTTDARMQWRLFSMMKWLLASMRAIYIWQVRRKAEPTAGRYYAALLRWGRCRGMSHVSSETPSEFGFRLADRFPEFASEIWVIIERFQCEVYGELSLGWQELIAVRHAWHRLRASLFRRFRLNRSRERIKN